MKKDKVYRATLRLADIQHFFSKPDISPFSEYYSEYSYTSGIEYVASELLTMFFSKDVQVTVLLPLNKIEPDLEQKTKVAVQRYCTGRLKEIEEEIRKLYRSIVRSSLLAIIGLVIFIGLGSQLTYSPSFFLQLLGQGLIVLGWVFAWFTLDSIFFGVRYYHGAAKVYKKLMYMHLTLKSDQ